MAHLVYQTAFIGDLVLSIPLLLNVKRKYPQEPLHLVCRQGFGSLFQELGLVDLVFEVSKSQGAGPYRALVKRLREEQYQRVWCPHQSIRTSLIIKQLRAKHSVGFKEWWNGWAFDSRVERPVHLPDPLRQLFLLSGEDETLSKQYAHLEGLENPTERGVWRAFNAPRIPDWASSYLLRPGVLSGEVVKRLEETTLRLLSEYELSRGKFALLAPGSVWPTKRWTIEGYAELALELRAQGWQVVVMGSSAEQEVCQALAQLSRGALNLAGKTSLWESLSLMNSAKVLICNDSGAAHLASCVGLPTVAVFGPTTLDLGYRPWQEQAIVVQKDLSCRPCGKHGAVKCPLGTHECMKAIKGVEVLEHVLALR
ncbi:MAG: glycosyltransferase family 9 protein [Bdellovibrionales bacterium]|nr:glycosyltransferase family 9 protein [Bdellovibrionales bacterium]